jgi:DNA-3-methyladenine glycosylase II
LTAPSPAPVEDPDFLAAADELARRDPALARWIVAIGPPQLRPAQDSYFAALTRSIVFQQLAGKAANAIHGRLVTALGGTVTPEAIQAAPDEVLRAAGLSGGKLASLRDLASRALSGQVPLDDLDDLSDDEIVKRLSAVRGIGRWTAEMFLIFQLRRPDVWPVDDLGVRRGYAVIHGLPEWPKPKELAVLGDAYQPYRTVAAWYCWRTADTILPD